MKCVKCISIKQFSTFYYVFNICVESHFKKSEGEKKIPLQYT